MKLAIIGAEAAKFTKGGEWRARDIIIAALGDPLVTGVVSGGCHLGGVDVWAEEEACRVGIPEVIIHRPKVRNWSAGYKPRNLLIARDCDEVLVIVVSKYHSGYGGMTFPICYHCARHRAADHVKSGACWTANQAIALGKPARWEVVEP